MNLITMVPATARFIAQMRGMRRYIVENNVTEFAVFQNWCDENNERWAEALDSGCAIAIEKFIADWNGRADANRWKHAAQPDDNIWDKSSKKLISSSQMMGTRGGGTSGSWFPGKPETPQKRHGKGCGGTPFSMPFLLSH